MDDSVQVRPTAALLTIPWHLLENICELLALCDYNRSSLFSFSLVNKTCCSATSRQRLRRFTLTVRSAEELHEHVQRCINTLEKNQGIDFLRILKVRGRGHLAEEEKDLQALERPGFFSRSTETEDEKDQFKHEELFTGTEQGYFDPPEGSGRFQMGTFPVAAADVQKQNERWDALARLIQTIGHLEEFIFDHGSQLPRCVLSSLHQYHPRCRLHIHNFHLPSLLYPANQPKTIDSHDLALATSPYLTSVKVRWYDYWGRNANYNREAVVHMIRRFPQMKHVWWVEHPQGRNDEYRIAKSVPRPEWPGFPEDSADDEVTPQTGHLETLILQGNTLRVGLQEWIDITDFSKLTTLHIEPFQSLEELDHLVILAANGTLGSVVNFGLNALRIRPSLGADYYSQVDAQISIILSHLQPLQSLVLWSPAGQEVLTAIKARHGERLQRLHWDFNLERNQECFDLNVLRCLQEHCSGLRELKISYLRTQGNKDEVAVYSILSQFPRLERLVLWPYIPSSLGSESVDITALTYQERSDALRVGLVNCAIDSKLVRSIFDLISGPGGRSRLHHLRFQPRVSRNYAMVDPNIRADLSIVEKSFAQPYVCEKSINPGGGIKTRHVGKVSKGAYSHFLIAMDECEQLSDQAWLDFFPDRTGDWPVRWSSYPLAIAN